ncbi:ANTAR domain-containing response regulator [Aneurinibacillus aneurinilyticus]|jgi:response regulator NasT|uniref:Response regulator n=2 Tax=Aneurinibacillus aneurinilyticus TaxID=1391 RepID=A0A848CUW0_ANEAE|nr:response regulator [Aneurinibacillus aneurinilyticus]ERI04291.1 response regulator receiver domain protein [Aneurinibacillus aneurinilyticus ATCC 12856]MCI1692770.1 response regulator [Aneurinibacillus aneurinilyticus]MED0668722.1 response regulator [Aneurinibacillus aneurinilyticus]MED0708326.1 response regulator [Aneurinibacillus aneurinilyticus]MED0722086.1 response regulator [Aneurinibacillus aneurinilyticus]
MNKGRIMVVDDESILRMDIKEMLQEAGYDVVAEANNGEAAIELAAQHVPDLIVMDVKMPKMNGVKAARIINRSFDIPTILLTAYTEEELIAEAREAFIFGYLVKPITERDLMPAVEVAIGQARRVKSLMGSLKEMEKKMESRKRIERAKGILMDVYQLNEERAYQTMRTYCMNTRKTMDEVANHILHNRKLDVQSVL